MVIIEVLILIIMVLDETNGNSDYYYISETPETWTAASINCKLATPELTYSGNDIFVNTSSLGLEIGEHMWIGYMQAYDIFQYIGCVETNFVLRSVKFDKYNLRQDPGLCYSACGRQGYIGLSSNTSECYCLSDSFTIPEDHPETECTDKCRNPLDTACGGVGHLSLYKAVTTPPLNQVTDNHAANQNGECIVYEHDIKRFFWTKCSSSYETICQKELAVERLFLTASWHASSITCFQNNLYPMTYGSTKIFDRLTWNPTSPIWTGMLRSPVVYDYHDKEMPYYSHGYIEVIGGKPRLIFEPVGQNIRRKYICLKDQLTPGVTVTTSTEKTASLEEKEADNSLFIYIGVAIAVVVLVAAALIIYLIWRKWKRDFIVNDEKAEPVGKRFDFVHRNSGLKLEEGVISTYVTATENKSDNTSNTNGKTSDAHGKLVKNGHGKQQNGKRTDGMYAKPGAWKKDQNIKADTDDDPIDAYDVTSTSYKSSMPLPGDNTYSHASFKPGNNTVALNKTTESETESHPADDVYAQIVKSLKQRDVHK